jgi:soluble lytic murein transglycosylase-like protein
VFLFFLAIASPAAVRAHSDPVRLYARALLAFNPQLGSEQSLRLARCVLLEADAQGLDARLLVALIAVESTWHPDAVSTAGADGLGQLMPGTAVELRVDAADPQANIHGTAVYLRALLDRYSTYDPPARYALALAAYNAGAGSVRRFGGVPPYPETQHYVTAVLRLWRRLAGQP